MTERKQQGSAPKSPDPWFVKIRDELERRDYQCKLKYGPINEYVRPNVDPYKYTDIEAFKRAYPFVTNNANCKLIKGADGDMDLNKRYFEKVRHKTQCQGIGGVWQPNINRKNKYDIGVCWTNADNAYCGSKYEVASLLRPQDVKTKNLDVVLKDAQRACDTDPRCKWVKTGKYSHDCFSKKSADAVTGKVMKPPIDMPNDVTTENIEKYLHDWYTKGQPSTPPKTNELFGKGNRCTSSQAMSEQEDTKANGYSRNFERVKRRLRALDPTLIEDRADFLRFMSEHDFKLLRKDFQELRNTKDLNDATREELYKKYIPDYFSDKVTEHLKSLEDQDLGSEQDNLLPSVPQSVVNMVMKHIAGLGNETSNRGMLAWHSTGSGKTCTATGVIDAFWDDEDRDIIFASSLDAIASNPDYKFHECAMNLYPRFQMEPFAGETKEETMSNISSAFAKRGVRFLSFAKLSNRVRKTQEYMRGGGSPKVVKRGRKPAPVLVKEKVVDNMKKKGGPSTKISKDDYVNLNKTVLIIDEVHNLFRPLATQRLQHEYLEKQLIDPKKFPGLKVVILTATPGDNIPDVLKLLNIIRDASRPSIAAPNIENAEDITRFKQEIRGLVSFFDMSSDLTKFPMVVDSEPVKYPMSMSQFNKYVEAYKDVKAEARNFERLAKLNQANKYWAAPRRYANTLFNFDKDMALSEFSSKLPALLENIKAAPRAKHYVYSAFFENRGYGGHGIIAIAKELEKLGYAKLKVAEAKKLNAGGKLPDKRPRYVLAITNEIGDEGSSSAGKNLHELIRIYNSRENKDGEHIHVFLASQGFNEGIDLKGVRHIHIFEPLVTWASDKQTLGRAARYCSHADLNRDNDEWKVVIHRYMSDLPIELKRPNFGSQNSKESQLRSQLEILTQGITLFDKKTQKKEIAETKVAIAEVKKSIKATEKEAKDMKKLDIENMRNVEEVIYQESRERMKQLLFIYQAMKEAAVDCRILQKFHSATGSEVKCELFEKNRNVDPPPRNGIAALFDPFLKG